MWIKNAKIYGEKLVNMRIENGLIQELCEASDAQKASKISKTERGKDLSKNLSKKLSKNSSEDLNKDIDAGGLSLLPSFIDLNVNLKNDKFSLENLALLEQECLKSGVSALILRDKMSFDEESFDLFLNQLKSLKVKVFASVSALDEQKKLKNLATLINKNALAIELESSSEANILRQSMQYALMKGVPLFVRCFEGGFDDHGVISDGKTSFELGLVGISKISELSEVAKIKQIAKFYQALVLYDMISLKESLSLLDSEDLVLASIHHFIKTDEACKDFNTSAKLMPPLQNETLKASLEPKFKGCKVKFLSALHSPKSIAHKDLAFDEASFGIHSLCEYMSLCYTFLVREKLLSWRALCELTSLNAARFLKLNAGEIAVGKEASFVLFDEGASVKAAPNSLYVKDDLKGKVKAHFIKGERVY